MALAWIVSALLLAALLVYFILMLIIRGLEKREDGSLDERDATILNRANAGIGGAIMTVIAVWTAALTEAHIETHTLCRPTIST